MAKTILGKVAFLDRGNYSSTTKYSRWDMVTTADSTYISLKDNNQGVPVANVEWWKCIANGKQATSAAEFAQTQGAYAQSQGEIIESDHLIAVDDHDRADDDHASASTDHSNAVSDHSSAQSDHTTASTDHNTAVSDHTKASTDHSTARTDHTLAVNDHSDAVADHAQATADHAQAVADHGNAVLTTPNQGLTDTQKENARANIGAGEAEELAQLALQVDELNKDVLGTLPSSVYNRNDNIITGQNVYGVVQGYCGYFVEVDNNTTYKVINNDRDTLVYALLLTNSTSSGVPSFANGSTSRIYLSAGDSVMVNTGNANYLFFNTPTSLLLNKCTISKTINLITQVGANKSDIEAIPFSYMAGARVGTSDDLTPDNVATSETIKERIAGGTQTIKKGSALVEKVKGNTAVWNQLVQTTDTSVTIPSGHKYLAIISGNATFATSTGSAIAVAGGTDYVHDLTQMFGSGNEPTTLAEFEARCPKVANPYEYNAGTIVGMTAEGVQCTGVNLWDEEYKLGYYGNDGEYTSRNDILCCKNKIAVAPSATLYIKKPSVAIYICAYDANMGYISRTRVDGNTISLSANTYYIAFNLLAEYGTTYKHDICISVSNPATNGNYYPYSASARTWGNILTSAFGGTMHAVGSVYDEIGLTKAVKRMKKVVYDGTENWEMMASGLYSLRITNDYSSNIGNRTSNLYTSASNYYPQNDKCFSLHISANEIAVRDNSYTTLADFKAHLASTPLVVVYELATPTETTYDELAMTYKATPNGMESMVAEGASAPLKADIVYPINAQGSIRNNSTAIGTLSNLATTAKTDLVSAINELYNMITNG